MWWLSLVKWNKLKIEAQAFVRIKIIFVSDFFKKEAKDLGPAEIKF